jgi:hypothetical protein
MSTFIQVQKPCPRCGAVAERSVATSINAARSPHYREAILAEQFQRFTCSPCGAPHVVDDRFLYIDFGRGHWFLLLPLSWEPSWAELEHQPTEVLDQSVTPPFAPPVVTEMIPKLAVRAVFGLAALREKLLCFEHALDDGLLEVLKLELLRSAHSGLSLHPGGRPRLDAVSGDELRLLARVAGDDGKPVVRELRLPRGIYDELSARAPEYSPLLSELRRAPYVDIGRLLLGE